MLQLKSAQVGFILLVSGFVVYEILSEWSKSKAVLKWAPDHLNEAMGITSEAAGSVSAAVLFLVFPAILFSAVALLSRLLSSVSVGTAARTFALLLLPTMAAAHLVKAMLKMTSRIPYWSGVFSDPKGETTAQQIMDKTLILDKSVPDALGPVISYLAAGIFLTTLAASLLILWKSTAVKKLNMYAKIMLLVGILVYWGVFGVTIYLWRF